MKNRISVIWIFCCSFLCLILGRATYLQVWTHFNDDHKLKKLSNNQFNSRVILRPKRGEIFDRNFESLVVNDEVQSLAANPNGLQKIKKEHWVARQLSHALSLPLASLQLKVKSDKNFVWIKRHLTPADLQALSRAGLRDRKNEFIDGLWLVKETQRNYPQGTLARAILGKVNVDGEGIDGIELQSNSTLTGKTVSLKATRDALGRPTYVESSALEDTEVIHGLPLTLTLDSALQFAVEEELRTAIQKYKACGGMVLVMNSMNGEILAAANQDTTKFQLVRLGSTHYCAYT
jgi:cell division protein FtsI/penicillin-binding protein 2